MQRGNMPCFFKDILKSCNSEKTLERNALSNVRILKLISCSKERKDNMFSTLENTDSELLYHGDCYREYTSREKIARWLNKLKMKKGENSHQAPKVLRR